MRWNHARKGIIEGDVLADDGVWLTIELKSSIRMGHGDPALGTGFRDVTAPSGARIQVRKCLLQEVTNEIPD